MNLNASLIPATLADYVTLQNMARFYVYDMSRDCGDLPGWECPESGLFECIDFKKYLENQETHSFFIKVGREPAGFVFVNKLKVLETLN